MTELAELLRGTSLEVAPRLLGAVLRHGDVAVRLTEVQRAGKRPMSAEEFLRGVKQRAGAVLG